MQSFLKSYPPYARLFIFIGGALLSLALGTWLLSFILQMVWGLKPGDMIKTATGTGDSPHLIPYLRWMLVGQFFFLFVIPCWIYARQMSDKPANYLLLQKPWHIGFWVLGILVMLTVVPLSEYLGLLNQKAHFGGLDEAFRQSEEAANAQLKRLLTTDGLPGLLLNLVIIAGFAGVGEELFFRGVVQRILTEWTRRPWIAIIVTGLLFSAIHFQFFGFLPRAVLGIVLGVIYWYSGSLIVAMVAHFVYDALGILLIYANPEMLSRPDQPMIQQNQNTMLLLAIASLIVTVTLFLRMKSMSRSKLAMLEVQDEPKSEPWQ